jgi:hypothetical protein
MTSDRGFIMSQGSWLDRRGGIVMATKAEKVASESRNLTDVEKLRLVDAILADLDKPDPELDRI